MTLVPADDTALSQAALWDAVAGFLRPGDIVFADQGTCFYGMDTHRLPHGVTFVGKPLWASIGYPLPVLLGVCLAEPGRRGILMIGDGAAQMTVQELGTVIRHGLTLTVIVVDNDGYSVERAIHGATQPYNDISRWDWTALPAFFGGPASSDARKVGTVGELHSALRATGDSGHTHSRNSCKVATCWAVPATTLPTFSMRSSGSSGTSSAARITLGWTC